MAGLAIVQPETTRCCTQDKPFTLTWASAEKVKGSGCIPFILTQCPSQIHTALGSRAGFKLHWGLQGLHHALEHKYSEHTHLRAANQQVYSPLFVQVTCLPCLQNSRRHRRPLRSVFAPKHGWCWSTPCAALALITIFAFSTLACLKPHWLCLCLSSCLITHYSVYTQAVSSSCSSVLSLQSLFPGD